MELEEQPQVCCLEEYHRRPGRKKMDLRHRGKNKMKKFLVVAAITLIGCAGPRSVTPVAVYDFGSQRFSADVNSSETAESLGLAGSLLVAEVTRPLGLTVPRSSTVWLMTTSRSHMHTPATAGQARRQPADPTEQKSYRQHQSRDSNKRCRWRSNGLSAASGVGRIHAGIRHSRSKPRSGEISRQPYRSGHAFCSRAAQFQYRASRAFSKRKRSCTWFDQFERQAIRRSHWLAKGGNRGKGNLIILGGKLPLIIVRENIP